MASRPQGALLLEGWVVGILTRPLLNNCVALCVRMLGLSLFDLRIARSAYDRRFLRSTVLQALFDFVVSNGGVTGAAPFSLVTRFPRRVFTSPEHGQATFEQAGLTGKQEAFMVEVGSS